MIPHEPPKPGDASVTIDYAAFVDSSRIIAAVAGLVRQCTDEPDTVNAESVLERLRAAGVKWGLPADKPATWNPMSQRYEP